MKAIVIEQYGAPEVLQYKEVPRPAIKPDEILVQMYSAGVGPFDVHVRDGWYKTSPNYSLPMILGWELSGNVSAVGANVSKYKEGDAVFAHTSVNRNGCAYAAYAAVKESEAAMKPANLSYNEAAAVSMNGLTAWQALFDVAQLSPKQKILIHAAAGGVGHLAVQLAKWKGAYVIGTASAKNKEFLLNLGIDEVIDYTAVPFEKAVKEVDVVLDPIGGETLLRSFPIVKKGGVVVSIVDFKNIKQAADFGVRGENLVVNPNSSRLSKIAKLISDGKIQVHVGAVFPLKEAAKAHLSVQSGHVRGKIVLEIENRPLA